MNLCIFTGRTTKDIELRYIQDNMAVAKFSLAVDNGYGENKKTSFFDMTAFKGTAESMGKLISKGQKIMVQCEAQQNEWQDKDGNRRTSVNFIVRSWEFAESKNAQNGNAAPTTPTAATSTRTDGFMSIPDGIDDELPFN